MNEWFSEFSHILVIIMFLLDMKFKKEIGDSAPLYMSHYRDGMDTQNCPSGHTLTFESTYLA